ncbi:MAG TPA: hypothetical protein VGJ00_05250 [Rhabdochlamydiaceae bacterium]|jgi:hypothetical protein
MKKSILTILALGAGALLNADNTQNATQPAAQKPQVCTSSAKACELTTDEQAFSAKLNDQNRKAFEKFTKEQRSAVITSTKNGGDANEAVQKLASSQSSQIANNAEKAPAVSKSQAK